MAGLKERQKRWREKKKMEKKAEAEQILEQ